MDLDDVETSDPEELLELPPLKRQKLFHSPSRSPALTHASSTRSTSPVSTPPLVAVEPPLLDADIETEDGAIDASVAVPPTSPKPEVDAVALEFSSPSPNRTRSESMDPLLLFTPSRRVSTPSPPRGQSAPLSPFTPQPLDRASTRSPSPSPSVEVDSGENEPAPEQELEVNAESEHDTAYHGYALRQRQAKQINPYQHDKAIYKRTMRHNPDAIVKIRSPRQHGHRSKEDHYEEESQDVYQESQTQDVFMDHRQRSPSPAAVPNQLLRFLPPMPSDDEDDSVSREARELARAERAKNRVHHKFRKNGRAFPFQPNPSPSRAQTPESNASRSPSPVPPPAIMASPVAKQSTPLPWTIDDSDDEVSRRSSSPAATRDDQEDDEDDEDDGSIDIQQTVEEAHVLTEKEKKNRRKRKILGWLYPKVKVDQLLAAGDDPPLKRKRPKPVCESEDENHEPPKLLPGQSRRSKGKHPAGPVLGDPESEDEKEPKRERESDSEVEIVESNHRPRKRPRQTNPSHSISRHEKLRNGRPYERYLIDWMLSNIADPGDMDNTHRIAKKGGSSRRRRSRRTLHDYFQHVTKPRDRGRHTRSPRPQITNDDEDKIYHAIPHPDQQRQMDQRQLDKDRQAMMRANGVHVLPAAKGCRIEGQRINPAIRAQEELEAEEDNAWTRLDGYRQSRAGPSSRTSHTRTRSRMPQPPRHRAGTSKRRIVRGGRPAVPFEHPAGASYERAASVEIEEGDEELDGDEESQSEEDQHAPVWEVQRLLDFGISLVPVGKSFSPQSTYTGKGCLVRLLGSPDCHDPPRASHYSAHGLDVGPNLTTRDLLGILDRLFSQFFEYVVGIPDPGTNGEREWTGLAYSVCLHVTSLLAAGDEVEELKSAIERCIRNVVLKLRDAALKCDAIESSTFSLCWFAVELAFRAGFRWEKDFGVFKEACTVLVDYIVEFGLDATVEPLTTGEELDGTTVAHRALETLLGLWHLIYHACAATVSPHPLWELVQNALEKHRPVEKPKLLDGSEQTWHAIVVVSTVSQFSASGTVQHKWAEDNSVPRTGWCIVHKAMERLQADLRANHAKLNDQYFRVIVERCCMLWSRWQWEFNGATNALNAIGNFLRLRSFANLADEPAEFPDFIRLNDMELLARPIHHDETVVVLFLKLVYQTILADREPALKFLRTQMAVAAFPQALTLDGLSPLINSMSVLALALYFQPEESTQWCKKAEQLVKFDAINSVTRLAYIRGFMYLAVIMVKRKGTLPVEWLRGMMKTLADEFKTNKDQQLELCVRILARAVHHIVKTDKGYPNVDMVAAFLEQLPPYFVESDDSGVLELIALVIERRAAAFARKPAQPQPQQQPIEQESQDEYGPIHSEFADELLAREKEPYEKKLFAIVNKLRWPLWRRLSTLLERGTLTASLKASDSISEDLEALVYAWTGCGSIVVSRSTSKWSAFLKPYLDKSLEWDLFCRCRVDLLVLNNVLQRDSAAYPDEGQPEETPWRLLQERFLEVLTEALVSWYTTIEAEYVQLLLSGKAKQHPLLKDAEWLDEGALDKTARREKRLPFLRTVLRNMSAILANGNTEIIQYAIKMFAYMRRTHSEFAEGSDEQNTYTMFCRRVFDEFERYPDVLQNTRLRQWDGFRAQLRQYP